MLSSVDFCSGAGGMTAGLKLAGIEPILGIDLDPSANDTYKAAHGRVARGNVSQFAGMIDILECHADLLVGGPPCQPFSVHGKQGAAGDGRDCIPFFIDTLAAMKPRAFIMENVANLAAPRHREYLTGQVSDMIAAGPYFVHSRVLDAADYGVPQHRRRLFVVGFLFDPYNRGDAHHASFAWPEPTHISPDETEALGAIRGGSQDLHVVSLDALVGVPECEPNESRVVYAKNPVWRPRLSNALLVNGKGRVLDPRRPAPTVTAESSGNGGHIIDSGYEISRYHRYLEECARLDVAPTFRSGEAEGARRITWREAARLQGFTDDYPFQGTASSKYRQIGNALPPPLAAAVGRAVVKHLEGG